MYFILLDNRMSFLNWWLLLCGPRTYPSLACRYGPGMGPKQASQAGPDLGQPNVNGPGPDLGLKSRLRARAGLGLGIFACPS